MSWNRVRIATCLCLSLLSAADVLAQTQGLLPMGADPGPQSMVLSVASDRLRFVLYEPVFVTCMLRNPTFKSIVVNVRTLSLSDNNLTVAVQEGDGAIVPYRFGPIHDALGVPQLEMLPAGYPGEALVETLRIFYNNKTDGVAFPRAGLYRIHAKVFLGNFPDPVFVNAAPLEISVVEPSSLDGEVIRSLGSGEELVKLLRHGATDYCQGDAVAQCYSNLRSVVIRFADSAYAPAIALSLAASVGRSSRGRQGDSGLQVAILSDFLDRWPKHTAAPIAMQMLAVALGRSGQSKEALEWTKRFEELYPERVSPRRSIERSEH